MYGNGLRRGCGWIVIEWLFAAAQSGCGTQLPFAAAQRHLLLPDAKADDM
jgi:hypothetical protein